MTISPLERRKLQISSKIENLTEVENMINGLFEELDIEQDHYGNMLVSLTEAVNNAITHGNQADESKLVNIEYHLKDGMVVFTIADEGNGFDYENIPDPTLPENLEKPDGRGVFLMKNLADEVEFIEDGRIVQLGFKVQ